MKYASIERLEIDLLVLCTLSRRSSFRESGGRKTCGSNLKRYAIENFITCSPGDTILSSMIEVCPSGLREHSCNGPFKSNNKTG